MEYNKEHMAKVYGDSLPISPKKAMEMCQYIRNKSLSWAKQNIQAIIEKKQAMPFTRFNRGLGHRRNIGPGRYPITTAKEMMKLLNALEANAQFKGLDTNSLVIVQSIANRAGTVWHHGRQRRRVMKRAHVELIVEEKKELKKEKKEEPKEKKSAEKKLQKKTGEKK